MRKSIAAGVAVIAALLIVSVGGAEPTAAQEKDGKDKPKFLFGHDFRVRTGGKSDFNKDTPKIGVEFYHDEATSAVIAISETGAISVAPAGQIGKDHNCKWLTAHDLGSRKVGETDFTQKTKKFGVELFNYLGANRLLYICESGSVAFAPVPGGLVTEKGPRWHHSFEPRLRGPDQPQFDNAKKISVEVFKDENTGGLIYITDTGAIATGAAPATAPDPKSNPSPKIAYGWTIRTRGADEADFSEKTKKMGVEIFEDVNADNQLLYITETGYIATAPNPGKYADTKGMTWKPSMTLKVRKSGEKEFKDAKKFGIEVFVDNRTGNLVFINDLGSIAVLPKP
ncbi:MAG TPA: hypothetical protein VG097_04420 [Gemmata sp.]|jgi:hypothetical protein|nr:hypothetical protein [Gemmata sp.]